MVWSNHLWKQLQLHFSQTLKSAGYQQSINDKCLFDKTQRNNFSYILTHSDDLLHCVNCNIMAQVFKDILIKIYVDIQYHDEASYYIGMSINRSSYPSKIYMCQHGLFQRIISKFFPDDFPKAASPASSNLFNLVQEDKPFDHIKYLSIIMAIMYLTRLTRPDVLLATSYLATKAQQPWRGSSICSAYRVLPKRDNRSWHQNLLYRA